VMLTLTDDWAQYSAVWKDLKQGTFGVPKAPFNPSALGRVAFNIGNMDMPGDIWLDQVGFFKGTPPTSPFPVADAGAADGASESGADSSNEAGAESGSDDAAGAGTDGD